MRCDAEAPEVPRGYLGEIVAPRTGSIASEPAALRQSTDPIRRFNELARSAPKDCGRAVDTITGRAEVAQLVEHVTENHGVGGSIPPLGTTQEMATTAVAANLASEFERPRSNASV